MRNEPKYDMTLTFDVYLYNWFFLMEIKNVIKNNLFYGEMFKTRIEHLKSSYGPSYN
jgi:hypothetical protein